MKKYQMPATDIVAYETNLCQMAAQSQTGDQGAPQFAPGREASIID